MHIKSTVKLLSIILFGLSLILLIPAAVALFNHESLSAHAFALTFAILAVCSAVAYLYSRKATMENFTPRDAFLFTVLAWLIATAFGAIPLVLSKTFTHYSDAFFEIMSGFTTTGATRLTNIEACPKSILLWRALTNWLGGMGIVVLFVSLLPAIGKGAETFFLMGAETVGPVKSKLTPRTKTTAKVLWLIYIALTLLQIILLLPSKMGLFNSITTAFSTVSTAGFTTQNASIGQFNSAYVDIVVTLFMILAGVNFSLYYKLITGKRKEVFKNTELRVYLTVILIAALTGSICLMANGVYSNFFTAIRYMIFHVVSIITTTGFTTANYLNWPSFALFVLVIMMFIGGCAGSTGGGIKVIRLITAFKASGNTIRKRVHPNAVLNTTVDGQAVPQAQIASIMSYIVLYFVTWLAGAFVISLTGMDIQSCLSSSILTLGNIGAGFGSETFATLPQWTNWVYSFLMMAGRLELYTIFVLFAG